MSHPEKSEVSVVTAKEHFLLKCRIKREEHSSGYKCIVCEGNIDGKSIFLSGPCLDSIKSDIPLSMDAPTENEFQIWERHDKLEFPVKISGEISTLKIEKEKHG